MTTPANLLKLTQNIRYEVIITYLAQLSSILITLVSSGRRPTAWIPTAADGGAAAGGASGSAAAGEASGQAAAEGASGSAAAGGASDSLAAGGAPAPVSGAGAHALAAAEGAFSIIVIYSPIIVRQALFLGSKPIAGARNLLATPLALVHMERNETAVAVSLKI